jgi:hypothetical protein
MLIAVVAGEEHPDVDDWVTEQARAEAARNGVDLGEYLERRVWSEVDVDCHVFSTRRRVSR